MPSLLKFETQPGEIISYRGATLIPFAQTIRLNIPGINGGLIWRRPVSLLIIDANGKEEVLPIQDITRQILWALLGASIILGLAMIIKKRK